MMAGLMLQCYDSLCHKRFKLSSVSATNWYS